MYLAQLTHLAGLVVQFDTCQFLIMSFSHLHPHAVTNMYPSDAPIYQTINHCLIPNPRGSINLTLKIGSTNPLSYLFDGRKGFTFLMFEVSKYIQVMDGALR